MYKHIVLEPIIIKDIHDPALKIYKVKTQLIAATANIKYKNFTHMR